MLAEACFGNAATRPLFEPGYAGPRRISLHSSTQSEQSLGGSRHLESGASLRSPCVGRTHAHSLRSANIDNLFYQYKTCARLSPWKSLSKMPDPVARQWGDTPQAIGRHVVEDAVIERYRAGSLSHR